MTVLDPQLPETNPESEPVAADSPASAAAVMEVPSTRMAGRTRPATTRWARRIRVARIHTGRIALSVTRWARERIAKKGESKPGRFAHLRGVLNPAVRSVKRHPRLATIAACILIASLAVAWKSRRTAPDAPASAEKRALVLEDVKVFQPPDARDLPPSNSRGDQTADREPRRISPGGARLTSGPAFPTIGEPAIDGNSSPMPATPRAVWLSGTVEDVDQEEPRIRAVGNVELPITERVNGPSAFPRVPRRGR